ncbi:alpha-2 adrenergic receptor [Trichonephila clavipes]|nr:alpha-2 adrenergic receptor [Trichonephila clavipes]
MKIGSNGNLVLGPFDESMPCLMIVLMNCQTKLRINHLTAVKSVAILESNANLNFYTGKKTLFMFALGSGFDAIAEDFGQSSARFINIIHQIGHHSTFIQYKLYIHISLESKTKFWGCNKSFTVLLRTTVGRLIPERRASKYSS